MREALHNLYILALALIVAGALLVSILPHGIGWIILFLGVAGQAWKRWGTPEDDR